MLVPRRVLRPRNFPGLGHEVGPRSDLVASGYRADTVGRGGRRVGGCSGTATIFATEEPGEPGEGRAGLVDKSLFIEGGVENDLNGIIAGRQEDPDSRRPFDAIVKLPLVPSGAEKVRVPVCCPEGGCW